MSNKVKEDNNVTQAKEPPQIKCYTCNRILENQRYVRCMRCSWFVQCLQCLSLAKSPQDQNEKYHNLTHQLLIIEPHIGRPLIRQGWDQEEEILLLYGVKNLGIGNWHGISELIRTKTPRECEEYYLQTFIENSLAPLPDNSQSIERYISKIEEETQKEKKVVSEKETKSKSKEKKKKSSKSDSKNDNESSKAENELSIDFQKLDQNADIDFLSDIEYDEDDMPQFTPTESIPSQGHEKNLRLKKKSFPTIPAEYSEFMPYRHEFDKDKDYIHDAEILVAKISFSEQDNSETFGSKIERLLNYNKILTERKFRTARIEEWGIHLLEPIPQKDANGKTPSLLQIFDPQKKKLLPTYDFVELPAQLLKGVTVKEKQIDEKLIPLASYCSKDTLIKMADLLHQRERRFALIKSRLQWQLSGVKTVDEGQLFNALMDKTQDGKIIKIDEWNETLKKYEQQHHKQQIALNEDFFTPAENELMEKEDISPQEYSMYKDMIIREFTIHNCLPKSRLAMMCNMMGDEVLHQLECVYDLCAASGWIIPS